MNSYELWDEAEELKRKQKPWQIIAATGASCFFFGLLLVCISEKFLYLVFGGMFIACMLSFCLWPVGNIVTVTQDHSVMIERAGILLEVKPADIQETDILISISQKD